MIAAYIIDGAIVLAATFAFIGALVGIIAPDHRNPVTRRIVDRIERHP
jgi:hypothetical protein